MSFAWQRLYCNKSGYAFNLINRQKAEIENYSHNIKNLTAENMQLQAEIKGLKEKRIHFYEAVEKANRARVQAIKEYKETLIFNIVNTPIKKTTSAGPFYLSGCADRQNEIIDIIKDLSSKCSKSVTICQQNQANLPCDIGDTAYCVNGYGSNRYIEKFTVAEINIRKEGIWLTDTNGMEWLARVCHFSPDSAEKELKGNK